MEVLAWLVVPAVATLAAMVWVWWAGRPDKPRDADDNAEAHDRFRAAMQRPLPTGYAGRPEPAKPSGAGGPRTGTDRPASAGGSRVDAVIGGVALRRPRPADTDVPPYSAGPSAGEAPPAPGRVPPSGAPR